MLAGLASPEAALLSLKMAACSLCPPMISPQGVHLWGLSPCVQIYSSYKDTKQIGLGPILKASFNLITSLKAPIFRYSHILSYWGLGLQYMDFGGNTIQPITLTVTIICEIAGAYWRSKSILD